MNKQRGLTLTGLIITAGVIVFFALIGFKLLPHISNISPSSASSRISRTRRSCAAAP
jgi:hypothetical protein